MNTIRYLDFFRGDVWDELCIRMSSNFYAIKVFTQSLAFLFNHIISVHLK